MGFWANVLCLSSLLWTGHCLGKSHHLLAEPIFSFLVSVGLLAIALAMSFHHACYGFVLLLLHVFVTGSQSAHLLVNFLLKASQTHFSLLYLSWALLANIPIVPAHFIMSFFRLPQPIYYLFTSITLMGFLLNLLDFLDPITTSSLLIATWAY